MNGPAYSLQDTVLHDRLQQIVRERSIKVVIETGVDQGLSTVAFSKMTDLVFAIDNNPMALQTAYMNLANAGRLLYGSNVVLCLGSSPDVVRALAPVLPDETLYFLDAHWQEYWPLLDEIKAIKRGKGVIVIHDFKVLGHPELGWDAYGGNECCYEYVKEALTAWSPKHKVEYNEHAEGTVSPRGCGIIFPE